MMLLCNGVEFYICPECGKCQLSGKNPIDMLECPARNFDPYGDVCNPGECEYYTENWEEGVANEEV